MMSRLMHSSSPRIHIFRPDLHLELITRNYSRIDFRHVGFLAPPFTTLCIDFYGLTPLPPVSTSWQHQLAIGWTYFLRFSYGTASAILYSLEAVSGLAFSRLLYVPRLIWNALSYVCGWCGISLQLLSLFTGWLSAMFMFLGP